MKNATLAFCILALTFSAVPPFLSFVLPRYVNESVSSCGSPLNGVVVLCVGFHNLCLASVDVEVIRKFQVHQLGPRCPVYGKYEYEC